MMAQPHVLLVTLPGQGHINPSLQFAKRLIHLGLRVTFATAVSAIRRMKPMSPLEGLTYVAAYSDGYDDGLKPGDDIDRYILESRRKGLETLSEFIGASIEEGIRFTCIVYGIMMPWVALVAREFHIPSTLLWNQPASVFVTYYYYFKDYGDIIRKTVKDPSSIVELPGLPPLASRDMPSFFLPANEYDCALPSLKQHVEILDEETKPKVLVNTFDALEPEAIKVIDKYNLVGIGPLIPSAFLDGNDHSDSSFGGDLFKGTNDFVQWLDSMPKSSVIYVSFGSILMLTKQQMEEIANGLLGTGYPFLWVIREGAGEKEEKLSRIEELKKQGMIVPWCSQVEVLSHPSVGCFLTHCGWNSALESLVSGVPMVTFPQLTDQGTNAKLVEDLWKTGVRVTRNPEERIVVEGHEIKRCLELIMEGGEKGEELRKNGKKWKYLAREAVKEDGSSLKNLEAFVHGLGKSY
ncbi:Indole-3-acetate beta-D-glucosyltransferase, putative isoform 1 [Theobroma cacao]|uniref:Glycosyltransferase n=1 Tax=Theobroma cacao TaxID=3641 RepID=A0A061EKD3_THECC|nr:Indole-3-acetate beta-D-glucosyltransferase, putative isoform 1 [Theobroma cacao]EOY05114.1 Indole-3-acetate beta-D-glucosyltransferase, putative isoform 1 [Theobroma cacao]EOY05115.1 Indole-3-acetate beta-D-glucosyltransferase, putative isoform 1 [Theobroma cacao]